MKFRDLAFSSVVLAVSSLRGYGQTLTWDITPGVVGTGDSAITGGTGNWNLTAGNWTNDSGATNVAWDNSLYAAATAVFGGTNGTVTIDQATSLRGIRFASGVTAYTLSGTGSLGFGASQGSIDSSASGATSGVNHTISAALTGSAGLTIAANGNMTASGGSSNAALYLSGTNTSLTGGITITSGLVNFTSASAAGSALTTAGSGNALTLNGGGLQVSASDLTLGNHLAVSSGGGTLRAWGGRTLTLNGVVSGSGTLNKTDNGTVLVTNTVNTFNGTLNVQAGIFRIGNTTGNATYAFGATAINVSSGSTLSLGSASGGTITVNYNFANLTAPISVSGGTLNFSQTNNTTQNLGAAVAFSGNSTVSLSASAFSGHSAVFNGALTGNSGTLTFNATGGTARNFTFGNTSNAYTGGVILGNADASSSFNLNQVLGAAFWTINDADWTVNISNTNHTFKSLSSSVNSLITATGTSARLSVGSGNTDTSYAGRLNGTLGLTKEGTGKLTLGGTNTYSGSTRITNGTLALGATGSLASVSIQVSSGAVFDVSAVSGYQLTTGKTLVNDGAVNGAMTVNSGATLKGNGSFNSSVIISGNLQIGSSPGQANFTDLTLTGTSISDFEIGGLVRGTEYDAADVSGSMIYGGTLNLVNALSFDLKTAGSYGGTGVYVFDLFGLQSAPTGDFVAVDLAGIDLSYASGIWTGVSDTDSNVSYSFNQLTGDLTVTVVPEPQTLLLGGFGLVALLRRRRQ